MLLLIVIITLLHAALKTLASWYAGSTYPPLLVPDELSMDPVTWSADDGGNQHAGQITCRLKIR
jgi:hypothetical protein